MKISKADELFFDSLQALELVQKAPCPKKKSLKNTIKHYTKLYNDIPLDAPDFNEKAESLLNDKINFLKTDPNLREYFACITKTHKDLLVDFLLKAIKYETDVLKTYKTTKKNYDISNLIKIHETRLKVLRNCKNNITIKNLVEVLYKKTT